MYSIERKSQIISLLEKNGKVDVADLSDRLGASKETIRRDLHELETEGAVCRTHGGAVPSSMMSGTGEYPVSVRGIKQYSEKRALCKKAASFIEDGDIIFIDNSSTCRDLPSFIDKDIHVTILTNSINLIVEASKYKAENHTFVCLGGVVNFSNMSIHGTMALANSEQYYPSRVFISCAGITGGIIVDGSTNEVDTKKLMISHGNEIYVLADHTKWGHGGQVFVSELLNIDTIITDKPASDAGTLLPESIRVVTA